MNGNGNINLGRQQFGDLYHRKNVRNLSDEELADYREAFRRVYELKDNRGYQYFAGIHGLPLPYQCEHGSTLFLPWHRAYLYDFEKALQQQVPGVTIPYWDWTSERSVRNGIPRSFREEQTPDGEPNPLTHAQIMFPDDPEWITRREPGDPAILGEYAGQVKEAMEARFFHQFSRTFESAHNAVHLYCGADMSNLNYAAYDPLFWCHHAFIDKVWADWQDANPDAATPNRDTVLTPFNMTVGNTVDYRLNLGYFYAADEMFAAFVDESTEEGLQIFNESPTQATLPQHEQDFKKATLEFHNVHHAKQSYEARIYINEPHADEKTPTYDNPHYAGSYFFFGKGMLCTGDEGHCEYHQETYDKFDVRPPHHLTPYKVYYDITKCLKGVAKEQESVSVSLVCVDRYGRKLKDGIDLEGLSLIYRD